MIFQSTGQKWENMSYWSGGPSHLWGYGSVKIIITEEPMVAMVAMV